MSLPSVVCFGFPARGHTVPSLPVVAELCRRGVRVEYHGAPATSALVRASGARFVPYPELCGGLLRPRDLDDHLVRCVEVTEQLLPLLLQQVGDPDLVLFDSSALWGRLFAQQRGAPAVASNSTFAFNRSLLQLLGASALQPPAGWQRCASALSTLNADYDAGIRDHLDLMVPAAALTLVYTSRQFQPGGRYFAASYWFIGPLLEQRAREGEALPPRTDAPLAYVSLGTVFNEDHALLRRVAEVLTGLGWQVLVSLGDAAATPRGSWPDGVQVRAFVDQLGVLARTRLFVTHGGMNSVSEALAHAVPLLVIPQGVDQHLVGKQAENLGAALVLERDLATADNLRAAVIRLEREHESFRAAAARVGRSFGEVPPVASAVDAMLELLPRGTA